MFLLSVLLRFAPPSWLTISLGLVTAIENTVQVCTVADQRAMRVYLDEDGQACPLPLHWEAHIPEVAQQLSQIERVNAA